MFANLAKSEVVENREIDGMAISSRLMTKTSKVPKFT